MGSTGRWSASRGCALAIQERATSLAIGSRFGAFEIVAHHGSGAMADIWLARRISEVSAPRLVLESSAVRFAIKTLLKRRSHHSEYVERFAQEAALHSRLDHPNIVRLLDTEVEDGVRYMALDFIEGLNLRQMIHAARPRPIPRGVACEVMAGVCDALHYLHELPGKDGPLGLVHCDVSPENVMIGLDGRVKLIDFGLATPTLAPGSSGACAAVLETSVLRPGRHLPPGRLQYLAPERVNGGMLDRRSDIYAVGAMLFELVHGMRPFEADVTYELLTRICQGETVAGDPSVDPEMRRLIEHAMAVSPDDRFDTAEDLSEALRFLSDILDPDGQSVGAFVRRLFGLEEPEDAEEFDLLWTEEKATAEVHCLESPCDTPLLEEGTELDVHVRELLRQTAGRPTKVEVQAAEAARAAGAARWAEVAEALEEGARSNGVPREGADAGSELEVTEELAVVERGAESAERTEAVAGDASEAPASVPQSGVSEPKSGSKRPVAELFATVARSQPPAVDLFDTYGRRLKPPASGTFLAPRDQGARAAEKPGIKPARAAVAHFDKGWKLLREGSMSEALSEWEAAMQLDPSNRSYAVNVQKLRAKLQG